MLDKLRAKMEADKSGWLVSFVFVFIAGVIFIFSFVAMIPILYIWMFFLPSDGLWEAFLIYLGFGVYFGTVALLGFPLFRGVMTGYWAWGNYKVWIPGKVYKSEIENESQIKEEWEGGKN